MTTPTIKSFVACHYAQFHTEERGPGVYYKPYGPAIPLLARDMETCDKVLARPNDKVVGYDLWTVLRNAVIEFEGRETLVNDIGPINKAVFIFSDADSE